MERKTKWGNGRAVIDPLQLSPTEAGYIGPGAEALARYEDVHQELLAQQTRLGAQLEQLRLDGKTKSARSRELLGKKLTNSALLSLLQAHGLE